MKKTKEQKKQFKEFAETFDKCLEAIKDIKEIHRLKAEAKKNEFEKGCIFTSGTEPIITEPYYQLRVHYNSPKMSLYPGVIKKESEWMKIFNLEKGECDIKKDWFVLSVIYGITLII